MSNLHVCGCVLVALALDLVAAGGAGAAEVRWVPISASGTVISNDGSEIVITPGQRVVLELRLSDWAPSPLGTWQATLDGAAFGQTCDGGGNAGAACFTDVECFGGGACVATSGVPLLPAAEPCTTDQNCRDAFANSTARCNVDTGFCYAGWLDTNRGDIAIPSGISLVDTSTANYRFGQTQIVSSGPDAGGEYYGGTLIVDVSPDAVGRTYTIGLIGGVSTFLRDNTGASILPVNITPATIAVVCTSDAMCDDGAFCTGQETCVAGACVAGTFPCDPGIECDESNNVCLIECASADDCDDGNECSRNLCVLSRCSYPPEDAGLPCGDPSSSECDAPNTCDGAGSCVDNFVAVGTPCGDDSAGLCDDPDICDGQGACSDNFVEDGTFCESGEPCLGGGTCHTGECVENLVSLPPIVSRLGGGLNIQVTPQPAEGTIGPVALRVTSPDWPCVDKWVDTDGFLVDMPVEQLPVDWGTVTVSDSEIVPNSEYHVVAVCHGLETEAGIGRSSLFGDLTPAEEDNTVDFRDISLSVGAFLDQSTLPLVVSDIVGSGADFCTPNHATDFADISAEVDLFLGGHYSDYCDGPCP